MACMNTRASSDATVAHAYLLACADLGGLINEFADGESNRSAPSTRVALHCSWFPLGEEQVSVSFIRDIRARNGSAVSEYLLDLSRAVTGVCAKHGTCVLLLSVGLLGRSLHLLMCSSEAEWREHSIPGREAQDYLGCLSLTS
jgi:hypothetical protein